MSEEQKYFKALDPILSFSRDSVGYKHRQFVDRNGDIIGGLENEWIVGFKAYTSVINSEFGEPESIEVLSVALDHCFESVTFIFEFYLELIQRGAIKLKTIHDESCTDFAELKGYALIDRLLLIDSLQSQIPKEMQPVQVPNDVYSMFALFFLDCLCSYSDTWNSSDFQILRESYVDEAATLLSVFEKYDAIDKELARRSKQANAIRHNETYKSKELLREWHKNNRHEFLKKDGRINQNDAAEHIVYVLKLVTLKSKKVAEYLGVFEKEYFNSI